MRTAVFIMVALTILGSLYGYLGWRLIGPARLPAPWSAVAWCLVLGHLLLFPLAMFTMRSPLAGTWSDVLGWLAYLGMGLLSFLFVFVVSRDLLWLGARGIEGLASLFGVIPVLPGLRAPVLTVTNGLIVVASLILVAVGARGAIRPPQVLLQQVAIPSLPAEFEGFRIAQLTDVHIGPTIKRRHLDAMVDLVNAQQADLVAVTGDLMDGSVEVLAADAAPLARLQARDGVFYVTGNHDYYSGVEPWVAHIRSLGLDVLLNENRILRRGTATLLLGGITDLHGGDFSPAHRSDPPAAARGEANVKVLLAHQPRSARAAREAGFDLVISGHTHGGQFFPWNLLIHRVEPFVAGLYDLGGAALWVSRGAGYWGPPVRLGAPADISVLELVRAVK